MTSWALAPFICYDHPERNHGIVQRSMVYMSTDGGLLRRVGGTLPPEFINVRYRSLIPGPRILDPGSLLKDPWSWITDPAS